MGVKLKILNVPKKIPLNICKLHIDLLMRALRLGQNFRTGKQVDLELKQ